MGVFKLGISGFPGLPFSVSFLAPKMARARPRSDAGGRSGAVRQDGFDANYAPCFRRGFGGGRSASPTFFIPKNVCLAGGFKLFVC